jgi:putative endonuclease
MPPRSEGCPAIARRATADLGKPSLLVAKTGLVEPYCLIVRSFLLSIEAQQRAMKYVYILESLDSEHFYVGVTDDLRTRLAKHNAGEVPHTSKYGPWRMRTYIAFNDEQRAIAFEKYLKSGSGRAFAKKHF